MVSVHFCWWWDEELKQLLQNVAGQAHKHSSEVWEQKQI